MKFFLRAVLVFAMSSAYAQSPRHCGTIFAQERLFEIDPSAKERFDKLNNASATASQNNYKSAPVPSYTIPVVFHVLHLGGFENISDAQIHNAIAILNRDFQKKNADTINIVTQFQSSAADCQIQFSLATLDEFGQCTNGITRHYTSKTNWQVSSAYYSYTWDPTKYMNIYVVNSLQNGAAAYAYLPGTASGVMDAIVSLHDYVGSIGTSNVSSSRTLTHEVGHWLNLHHVWGANNNPGVACGDDAVGDTPITEGHFFCDLNSSVCTPGVVENVQNYMEYSYCTNMFTYGQKARMHNALNSNAGGRDNLSTASNVIATGVVNPVYGCAPKAEYHNTTSVTCVGNSLTFTDLSYNAPVTNWSWSSPLASNTSSQQNGSLTFSTPGLAPVKLVVSNSNGSDSITKQSVVVMAAAGSGSTNLVEGFENGAFPNNNWIASQPLFGSSFVKTTSTAASGSCSIWVNNYFDNPNGPVAVFSPAYNLQNSVSAILSFKYAYAQQSTMNNDILKVAVSVNCGATWTDIFFKQGTALSTTGSVVTQSYLNPAPSHWKTETLNLGAYSSYPKVYIKFEFTPGATSPGNNIFIDDINISQIVGLNESGSELGMISVYPNPFSEQLTIRNDGTEEISSVRIMDVSLRSLLTLAPARLNASEITVNEFGNYASGIYFAEIRTTTGVKVVKLVKL
jgi:PKD repeat protein